MRGGTSIYDNFFYKESNDEYFVTRDVPRVPFVHSLRVSHVFRGSRPFANSFTMEGAISSHWKKNNNKEQYITRVNFATPPPNSSTRVSGV